MSRTKFKSQWRQDRTFRNQSQRWNGLSTKKFFKRQANRKVRYYKHNLSNGKYYQKLYNPYNLCDYKWYVDRYEDSPKYFSK